MYFLYNEINTDGVTEIKSLKELKQKRGNHALVLLCDEIIEALSHGAFVPQELTVRVTPGGVSIFCCAKVYMLGVKKKMECGTTETISGSGTKKYLSDKHFRDVVIKGLVGGLGKFLALSQYKKCPECKALKWLRNNGICDSCRSGQD